MTYRGRFAPSPTGPLHFGSLLAATGSYLQARHHGGQWLVRIEDLDPPRAIPGSADNILRTLEIFGFEWDESVVYQSQRSALYQQALDTLIDGGYAYACSCSRSELQALNADTPQEGDELRYPGLCRHGPLRPDQPKAWRFRVPSAPIVLDDAAQGRHEFLLEHTIGDFVIKRRDGLFAYQLAVVVDDEQQRITDVVRGCDLLSSTPRQIALQQALHYSTPTYMHLPVVIADDGKKLSKSHAAPAVDAEHAATTLVAVLCHFQQSPPPDLAHGTVADIWSWAIEHWNPAYFAQCPLVSLKC
jgi:glutamyl-Q tRNA(Asp) synthetase